LKPPSSLPWTESEAANHLLAESPLALLIGMLLDQQFPMERAFAGPQRLAERLAVERLDPAALASMDPETLAAVMARPPVVHRYPRAMAARIQALAAVVVDTYGGDAAQVWHDPGTGRELLARLARLPGFGDQKARIFLALLGKQVGVRPTGWREAAGAYGEAGSRRSAADVVDPASLAEVRAFKREQKQAAKAGRR